jgi:hypothetical protein
MIFGFIGIDMVRVQKSLVPRRRQVDSAIDALAVIAPLLLYRLCDFIELRTVNIGGSMNSIELWHNRFLSERHIMRPARFERSRATDLLMERNLRRTVSRARLAVYLRTKLTSIAHAQERYRV